jgi:hyaluronoglucosaminidase
LVDSPIYHYQRVQYALTSEFLTKIDLENAIKARGGDGIVLWNEEYEVGNKTTCEAMKKYIETTLGPLVLQLKNDK